MDPRYLFRAAVLAKCASLGLTPDEACDALEQAAAQLEQSHQQKQANPWWAAAKAIGSGVRGGVGLAKDLTTNVGLPLLTAGGALAVGAPLLGGFAAGGALGSLHGINDASPEEHRLREMRDALRQEAEYADNNRLIAERRRAIDRLRRKRLGVRHQPAPDPLE